MASTCGGNERVPLYLNSDKYWTLSKKESSSTSTPSSLLNNNSSSTQTSSAFVTKCATLAKEQRARFYIMRRCLIMLICWHDYND